MTDNLYQNSSGDGSTNAGRDAVVNNVFNYFNNPLKLGMIESIIPKIIDTLLTNIEKNDINFDSKIDFNFMPTTEKMEYNNIHQYREIIEKYGIYSTTIDNTFSSFEKERPGIKNKFLKWINSRYLIEKGKHEDPRNCADEIIKNLITELCTYYKSTEGIGGLGLFSEDIDMGVLYLISRSFVECKVLETIPN